MSNGHIHHGSIHGAEHKPSPRFYKAELESDIAVRSLTFCPFGGEQFILAGCDDGSVRLHSVTSEKPLITWPGTVDGQPILQIIWSPSRLVLTLVGIQAIFVLKIFLLFTVFLLLQGDSSEFSGV